MANPYFEKQARNMVIMLNAGGLVEDVLALVKNFRLKAVHFDQLAVPKEEEVARRQLIQLIKNGSL